MTHILLLLAVELYLDGWPPISFGDNLERPNEEYKTKGMKGIKQIYQCFMSSFTSLSLNCRPIKRLKAKTVF